MKNLPHTLFLFLFPSMLFSQFGDPERVSMPHAEQVATIIRADVDSDGDIDVLSGGGSSGRIAWYNNDGTGHFSAKKDIAIHAGAYTYISEIAAADMDGDGDIDIVYTAKVINEIGLFPNLGNGEFGMKQVISTQVNSPESLVLFDADADGDTDIASVLSGSYSMILVKNNGALNFGSYTSHSCSMPPKSIKVGDIDGDGDKDLAVMAGSRIYVYGNNGNGTFGSALLSISNSFAYSSFNFCDMNGDTFPDFNICSYNGQFIQRYLNDGSGQFGIAQSISTLDAFNDIFSADIDNDGDIDLAGVMNQSIKWYENTNSSTFSEHIVESVPGTKVLITDIDNDGDGDILSASLDDNQVRCNLRGNGVFQPSFLLAGGTPIVRSITHADIDGDGIIDVVSATGPFVSWFPCIGAGLFGAQHPIISITSNGAFLKVAVEDIDNDGDNDVVAFDQAYNQIYLAINDGNGTFLSSTLSVGYYSGISRISFADYDNDGDKDIFIAGSTNAGVIKNNGAGNFTGESITSVQSYAHELLMVDMNNDGRLDPLYANGNIAYRTTNANGTFSAVEHTILSNQSYWDIRFVDLNQDGLLDILCGNFSGTIGWRKGNTSLTIFDPFEVLGDPLTLNIQSQLEVADPDNDGDLDFFFIHGDNLVNYYEHVGNMQFILHEITNLGEVYSLDLYDCDGDSDLDLFAGAYDVVEVIENQAHAPYQAKGEVFLDNNQNGIKDIEDSGLKLVKIISNPEASFAFSGQDGSYYFNFNDTPGTYNLSPQINNNWVLTTSPQLHTATISGPALLLDTLDFGFYPLTPEDSIISTLTGGFPRCNTVINYFLNIGNRGSSIVSGVYALELAAGVQFVSAAIPPDSMSGQLLYWHFDSIFYFSDEKLAVQVQMPDFTNMGNTLNSVLQTTVYESSGNATFSTTDTLSQILVCAYDPNDKAVIPAGDGANGNIPMQTNYLDYFVRFQNTGNDTAVKIVVRDVVDENLDVLGLEPLAASHPMEINIEPDGKIAFIFDQIMLPDSNTNEIASHGFVRFRLPLLNNLPSGTVINNTARIYFDANPAIETNTTVNTLTAYASYSSVLVEECNSYISPSQQYIWTETGTYIDTILNVNGSDSIITINLTIIHAEATMLNDTTLQAIGTDVSNYQWINCEDGDIAIPGAVNQLFLPSENGTYAVVVFGNNCSDTSECVIVSELLVQVNENLGSLSLAPNPTDGQFIIHNMNSAIISWELISTSGKHIASEDIIEASSINVNILGKSGMYFIIVNCQDGSRYCLPVIKR